jgi:hypothetical protein
MRHAISSLLYSNRWIVMQASSDHDPRSVNPHGVRGEEKFSDKGSTAAWGVCSEACPPLEKLPNRQHS